MLGLTALAGWNAVLAMNRVLVTTRINKRIVVVCFVDCLKIFIEDEGWLVER